MCGQTHIRNNGVIDLETYPSVHGSLFYLFYNFLHLSYIHPSSISPFSFISFNLYFLLCFSSLATDCSIRRYLLTSIKLTIHYPSNTQSLSKPQLRQTSIKLYNITELFVSLLIKSHIPIHPIDSVHIVYDISAVLCTFTEDLHNSSYYRRTLSTNRLCTSSQTCRTMHLCSVLDK